MSGCASGPVDVSVVVVTYNHEQFIAQALDSVVAQRTDRPIEIIVSEDCSTDATTAIVTTFAAWRSANAVDAVDPQPPVERGRRAGIRAARGRYICLLDGDDYWISPTKVERQAALLDAEPDVSACFHNAAVVPRRRTHRGPLDASDATAASSMPTRSGTATPSRRAPA